MSRLFASRFGGSCADDAAGRGSAVSARPADARPCAGALRGCPGPADRQPPRPHRSPLVCREPAVSRPGAAVRDARPLRVPDACVAGGGAHRPGRAARGRRPDRNGRTQDLAAVCQPLSPVRGDALAALAGSQLPACLRHRPAPVGGHGGLVLRPYRRLPVPPRVPPPRAVRAFQHRGDRHHRGGDRRSALAPDDPRVRLDRPRRHRLPARWRCRS